MYTNFMHQYYNNNNYDNNDNNINSTEYMKNSNNYNWNNYNSNINSSMLYSQVLTMTIIPLITTIFTTIFSSFVADTKKMLIFIVNYLVNKNDNKKCIIFELYKDEQINKEIIPLIWYINKTKSIKEGNLLSLEEINDNEKDLKNKVNIILLPKILSNLSSGLSSGSSSGSGSGLNYSSGSNYSSNSSSNNYSDQTNSNNSNQTYDFILIKDFEKKYYYGINKNSFCLMSYSSNINELGEYILKIKNEYELFKSELDKNIIKEKKIYIELYNNSNSNYGNLKSNINQKILPLIWYMNKKKLIEQGILINLDEPNKGPTRIDPLAMQSFMQNTISYSNNSHSQDKLDKPSDLDTIVMPFIEDNKENEMKTNNSNKENDTLKQKSNKNVTEDKLIEIDKHIFCNFTFKKTKSDPYTSRYDKTEYVMISSKKYTINELNSYLEGINEQYKQFIESKNKIQHLYSYVSGIPTNKFTKSLLDSTQTFDHLFFEKKNEIITDIKNFSNIEYYKKFGMKRKLGYLFYGPPGCGKTALVTAITNELGRSLKNIPISLVKTNNDLEQAFGEFSYDNQIIKYDNIVITFDEIDSANNIHNLNKNIENGLEDKKEHTNNNTPIIIINNEKNKDDNNFEKNLSNTVSKNDKLNIGILLSKIDGNEEQDGLVIIATCNNIDNLDPALYRNGRLKLVKLVYAGSNEIALMIEKYCEVNLSLEQINKIRNDRIIQTLNIKHLIANYLLNKNFVILENDIDIIINKINEL